MAFIQHQFNLKDFNSFGIAAKAQEFAQFSNLDELKELLDSPLPIHFLGQGSNVLLRQDLAARVLHNNLQGIELLREDAEFVWIKAGAGVIWHELVLYCINKGYAGIENLSLIPGTVGAAPMQNIGAYGVELKDVFFELEALHLKAKEIHSFGLIDCQFGYRDSVFKQSAKGQYCICSVTLQLRKEPVYNVSYGAIQEELGTTPLSIKAISDAVIRIRQSKLPNPKEIGNAGSFFKNPIVAKSLLEELQAHYPQIPFYPIEGEEQLVKLAAGWLIEQAGWKGKKQGEAGVHSKQALVLVNYGQATGAEIWQLALDVQGSVQERFGVLLQAEVNVW